MSPRFLILKRAPGDGDGLPPTLVAGLEEHGATVVAAAAPEEIEVLEPGSANGTTVVARFEDEAALRRFVDSDTGAGALDELRAGNGIVALSVAGLPLDGLPGDDLPTIASVDVPEGGPGAQMLIEGSASHQERMDSYRDIILPMMRELGSYYTVFELGGNVDVLEGEWDEAIFAISRWPSIDAAHAFWFSERYRNEAVPLRTGVSEFSVLLMQGRED